mmetsp:Transcript_32027/g.36391  ORF Transcript_32027/g.36391 Transcript_32027/m.36391 type:complete len:201 (+) Transcript_32027:25-627(+)
MSESPSGKKPQLMKADDAYRKMNTFQRFRFFLKNINKYVTVSNNISQEISTLEFSFMKTPEVKKVERFAWNFYLWSLVGTGYSLYKVPRFHMKMAVASSYVVLMVAYIRPYLREKLYAEIAKDPHTVLAHEIRTLYRYYMPEHPNSEIYANASKDYREMKAYAEDKKHEKQEQKITQGKLDDELPFYKRLRKDNPDKQNF